MYELFYRVEINAVCLLLLVWIIYQSRINQDQQTKNILFRNVMISSLAVLVLETVQLFVNGRVGTVAYIANYALSFVYLAMNAVMAYNWFVYTLEFIIGKTKLKRVFTTAVFVPVVFFIFLSKFIRICLSCQNHFIIIFYRIVCRFRFKENI